MNKIVTIGREFGSGGRELGRRLAEVLGFDYYDKEILTEIAKKTELSEEYVKQVVECRPHSLYPITVAHSFSVGYNVGFNQAQAVYAAQSDIITELAAKSNCVIIGRCADYILKDRNPLRIFVYADVESKLARCKARNDGESLSDRQLQRQMKAVDKTRAAYYSFYTGLAWGDKQHYDLMINTSGVDLKNLAADLAGFVNK